MAWENVIKAKESKRLMLHDNAFKAHLQHTVDMSPINMFDSIAVEIKNRNMSIVTSLM